MNAYDKGLYFGMTKGNILRYTTATGFETIKLKEYSAPVRLLYIDQQHNYMS